MAAHSFVNSLVHPAVPGWHAVGAGPMAQGSQGLAAWEELTTWSETPVKIRPGDPAQRVEGGEVRKCVLRRKL